MPVSRVQPGAIVGDSITGETTQFWGFSDLVKDLFHGRIPAVVGGAGYWMPLVPVDIVAQFIAGLADLGAAANGEFTLIDDATPDLDELLERIARHVGIAAVRRAVPKATLEWFLRHGGERLTGVSAEALSFIDSARYDVDATKRAMAAMGLVQPALDRAVLRTVDFLLATRFGADSRPPAESAGMRRVAGIPTFTVGAPESADVVLLPGIPLDASSWDGVAAKLAGAEVRTARADLPGLGRTTKETGSPAAWMESLLAGHGGRPWIVGHSLGTRYAVEHAFAHPDRVSGVVLDLPVLPPGAAAALPPERDARVDRLRAHARSRPHGSRGREARRSATRLARGRAPALASRGCSGPTPSAPSWRRRCALEVPVVILVGERDPLVEEAGDAKVFVVPKSGHFPQLDEPGIVAATITRLAHQSGRVASCAVARVSGPLPAGLMALAERGARGPAPVRSTFPGTPRGLRVLAP